MSEFAFHSGLNTGVATFQGSRLEGTTAVTAAWGEGGGGKGKLVGHLSPMTLYYGCPINEL